MHFDFVSKQKYKLKLTTMFIFNMILEVVKVYIYANMFISIFHMILKQ